MSEDRPIYYYNKNIANLIIGFLNIFNEFKIRRFNSENNNVEKEITVPILFGGSEREVSMYSTDKSEQRLIQLPLIHFDLNSMSIDKQRAFAMKSTSIVGYKNDEYIQSLMPYPYNFTVTMTIFTKYINDTIQLVEQIVPLFNYHRVYYITHPLYEEVQLSNWVNIISDTSFNFNPEYPNSTYRGIIATPIQFMIEGWLVREPYNSWGLIKEINATYYDYIYTSAQLSKQQFIMDLSIRELKYNNSNNLTVNVNDVIIGDNYNATILQIIDDSTLIVKFSNENYDFKDGENLKILNNELGTSISCIPWKNQTITEIII